MDEAVANILNESNRIISKLQLLSVFFEDELIYKIYLRSQVIHQLFETNPELDINKLMLFHLQFTTSVVELLKKIKKSNEQNVSLILDEIQLNRTLMDTLNDSAYTEKSFGLDAEKQAIKMGISLRKLYQVLSDDTNEYPFSSNLSTFSTHYAHDFFYSISPEQLSQLLQFNTNDTYTHPNAIIQRKLLGLLYKNNFSLSFLYGVKAGDVTAEVFRLKDTDRCFIFFPSRSLFLLCKEDIIVMEQAGAASKKTQILQELANKESELESRISSIKTSMPIQIKDLLTEYYKKIIDINFLQNMSNFDVQANILKTMLNTDSM